MTQTAEHSAATDRTNRLTMTRAGGQLVADYWDNLFAAREAGKQIVWYNGGALNPIFQAAGLAWCHGEAFAARLAAQRLEGPAQLAGAEYGYSAELCSYSRTYLGCSVLTLQGASLETGEGEHTGVVGMQAQRDLAARLPSPGFFVNNYAGCSTGQQWDGISYRLFGKQLPIFNISHPFLWGNKPDAGYLTGQEWEEASGFVEDQLRELIGWLEAQTGRPFGVRNRWRGRVVWMDNHWFAWTGPVRPVLWAGGQALLSSARRQTMFERFTDRSRRVVVLAQEEARVLNHNYIGTEHILLGLIREGEGVAARALESLGISLDAVRQRVEEIIGRGQEEPSGHIPFTPRAKKVLELSLRESKKLSHTYIGTEHILLGLIREGDGVAAQVLARLGADLNRVRQQVIELLDGIRPDTSYLDEQIEAARIEKEAAIDAQDFDQAVSLRDRETQLLAGKAARQEQWDLAEQGRQLAREVERLRALLRQHGIDPQDEPT